MAQVVGRSLDDPKFGCAVGVAEDPLTAVVRGTPAFVDLGTLSSAAVLAPRIDLTLELGDGLVLHLVRH